MTKKAAIFGWVLFWKGRYLVWSMTVVAEFFCFLFAHVHKTCVILVIGQVFCCFRRSVPEEKEQTHTDKHKDNVIKEYVFFRFHFYILGSSPCLCGVKTSDIPSSGARWFILYYTGFVLSIKIILMQDIGNGKRDKERADFTSSLVQPFQENENL